MDDMVLREIYDEQLDSISGGAAAWSSSESTFPTSPCIICGAKIEYDNVPGYYPCRNCGKGYILVYEDGGIWGSSVAD